jgi:hypothetical protein
MKKIFAWIFRLKTLTGLAFLVAALAAVLVLVILVINSRGRKAWEAYAIEAQQRGVKLSHTDFRPSPVPDAENFAAVPLFASLFSPDPEVRTQKGKQLSLPSSGEPESNPLSSMSDARLIDLTAWQNAFIKEGALAQAGTSPADDVLAGLEKLRGPALKQLAEAESRPRACFPVNWDDGFGALLPHLAMLRDAARIHALRLAAHLAKGDRTAALAEFEGLLRLYYAIENEPTAISGLVRISILSMANSAVWDGLARGQWSDAELTKIEAELAPINLLHDYHFALGSERAGVNSVFDSLRGVGPMHRFDVSTALGNGAPPMFAGLTRVSGFVFYNQLALNRYHDDRLARLDWTNARVTPQVGVEYDPERRLGIHGQPKRAFYSLFLLTVPALDAIEKSYFLAHTTQQLTRIACALERQHLATSAYPEKLDALMPTYLAAVPRDLIDGAPLRYRRTDNGRFLLYSIAMNARDDGGTPGKARNPRDAEDWVWRWPEAAAQPRK